MTQSSRSATPSPARQPRKLRDQPSASNLPASGRAQSSVMDDAARAQRRRMHLESIRNNIDAEDGGDKDEDGGEEDKNVGSSSLQIPVFQIGGSSPSSCGSSSPVLQRQISPASTPPTIQLPIPDARRFSLTPHSPKSATPHRTLAEVHGLNDNGPRSPTQNSNAASAASVAGSNVFVQTRVQQIENPKINRPRNRLTPEDAVTATINTLVCKLWLYVS